MKITLETKYQQQVFVAADAFSHREELKALGWRFDPPTKCWWVAADQFVAVRKFAADMTPKAKARLQTLKSEAEAMIARSQSQLANFAVPTPPGLSFRAFQLAGIQFLMDHPNAILGDEMGLGKTIEIIGLTNVDPSTDSVLVVCPATLRRNWEREFRKWSTRGWQLEVVESKQQRIGEAPVVVISYDLLDTHQAQLANRTWGLLVADEAHYLKNKKSRRASALLGVPESEAKARLIKELMREPDQNAWGFATWSQRMAEVDEMLLTRPDLQARLEAIMRQGIRSQRTVFASGTPIPNRPVELWPILQRVDPTGLGSNFYTYTSRYCAARRTDFGLDVSGASNLDELQIKLRSTCMIRRLKADVLEELPEKTRQTIEIPATGKSAKLVARELAMDVAIKKERAEHGRASKRLFAELSTIRRDLAVAKVPAVIDHISATLTGCEKLVVMAHHRELIAAIRAEFPDAVAITGETPHAERQSAIDRFQNDPKVNLFVGSIYAAGTGITLTAASTVVFAELDWVPGVVVQAEDRLHRIGQSTGVCVQYLVVAGSLDYAIAQTLERKTEVIGQALDNPAELTPTHGLAATWTAKAKAEGKEVEHVEFPPEQIIAIQTCLQLLVAADPDFARELNMRGFSAADCAIGHQLAAQHELTTNEAIRAVILIRTYARQLPPELVAMALGFSAVPPEVGGADPVQPP